MIPVTLSLLVRDSLSWFPVLAGLLILLVVSPALAGESQLKKGDRIVFLGDSITQFGERPGGYVKLVRQYLQQKHVIRI